MRGLAVGKSALCQTEYTTLKRVLIVQPSFMRITKVINETQKHYQEDNIDVPLAMKQHEALVGVLKKNGIEVLELPADPHLPEQVFTRDIAFVIHDQLFLSSMQEKVRKKEPSVLKTWLEENGIPYQNGISGSIEGGDVVIDDGTIFIGISNRTSYQAILDLHEHLPSYHIQPFTLRKDILHLDCVFNILDRNTALVYPQAFTPNDLRIIKSRFDTIPVTTEEQFHMGPNVLSIGNRKVLSLFQNERLNYMMKSRGFEVLEIDFSEIIKSGGSFRCCTLPLERESSKNTSD